MKNIKEEDIIEIVAGMKGKTSTDYFGFSNLFIKKTIQSFITPLTLLINRCITSGHFPETLKITKIIPVHKKGDLNEAENYRPIALVPVISKIIERVIAKQLLQYFEDNKLFSKDQYGYRQGRSTIDAIIALVEEIMDAFENKDVCKITFCDLSRAFDMVSHDILMKLVVSSGYEQSLSLFRSFLYNRSQYVYIKGYSSSLREIKRGVPQGSVLGPILFTFLSTDVGKYLPEKLILFADDTTLISRDGNRNQLEQKTRTNITLFEEWLHSNELILNKNKTYQKEFNIRAKITDEPVKFLGLHIDSSLTWKVHTLKLREELSKAIYLIRKLKDEVPEEIMKTAYFGIFQSKMAYGIIVWGAATEANIIFKLQKKVVRIMANKGPRDTCRQLFSQLGIMTLSSLYIYKNLMYLKEKENIVTRGEQYTYNTRSKDNVYLPFTRLVKSNSNPNTMSVKLFNKLPLKIKQLKSSEFKKTINNFLMKNSFYNINEYLENNWIDRQFALD
ncbi:hypothetical protein O3M35_011970 [Rhynocoris fuscipes]|uniref:Reverse transcriptase domain-containing protein n=1 Tax=Rhynocoris fuscipes TaxID=488301 RepID=A0AAW1CS31_9HEMI